VIKRCEGRCRETRRRGCRSSSDGKHEAEFLRNPLRQEDAELAAELKAPGIDPAGRRWPRPGEFLMRAAVGVRVNDGSRTGKPGGQTIAQKMSAATRVASPSPVRPLRHWSATHHPGGAVEPRRGRMACPGFRPERQARSEAWAPATSASLGSKNTWSRAISMAGTFPEARTATRRPCSAIRLAVLDRQRQSQVSRTATARGALRIDGTADSATGHRSKKSAPMGRRGSRGERKGPGQQEVRMRQVDLVSASWHREVGSPLSRGHTPGAR